LDQLGIDIDGRVQSAVEQAIGRGEIGVQVAAYLDGKLVIDVWGGIADKESGRVVDGDTLFPVFSATKGVASTALHMQVERGFLSYDDPIVKYWPEFGVHGKDRATVRHALTHSVGVPGMPDGTTPEQMCDWDWMCRSIAGLKPEWEPGTKHGYHAYTFGWLVGELVRRTDLKRRPFGQYVQDEICAPLGIRSLWLGIPDDVEPRIARLQNMPPPPPGAPAPPPDALILRAIPPHLGVNQEIFGRPDVRRSCHPGAGGIMNARSLARHYAMHANGGELDGVRLLSAGRIDQIRALQSDAQDQVIPSAYRRGLGYWLGGEPLNGNTGVIGRNPQAFGHPGAGGAIGWADPDAGLAVAITKNRMHGAATPGDNPLVAIADTVREVLGVKG
jgi:CubicO group peptidase (beta-lactamase class C family)